MTLVKPGAEILLEARRQGQALEQDSIPFLVTGSPDKGRVVWVGHINAHGLMDDVIKYLLV